MLKSPFRVATARAIRHTLVATTRREHSRVKHRLRGMYAWCVGILPLPLCEYSPRQAAFCFLLVSVAVTQAEVGGRSVVMFFFALQPIKYLHPRGHTPSIRRYIRTQELYSPTLQSGFVSRCSNALLLSPAMTCDLGCRENSWNEDCRNAGKWLSSSN